VNKSEQGTLLAVANLGNSHPVPADLCAVKGGGGPCIQRHASNKDSQVPNAVICFVWRSRPTAKPMTTSCRRT